MVATSALAMCNAAFAHARTWRRRGKSSGTSHGQGTSKSINTKSINSKGANAKADANEIPEHYAGFLARYASNSLSASERDDSPQAMPELFRRMDGSAVGSGACDGAGAMLPEGDTCSSGLPRSYCPPAARVGELSSSSSTLTEAVAPHLGPIDGDVGLDNWVTDLASQLHLDAPASAQPLTMTTGASSSSAHAALAGLLEPTLHQAPGLQQGVEHAALQRAGLQRAGRLSALRLPGMPPEQQDPAHGFSLGRSDHVYSPSDMKGLAPHTWANHLREVARGPDAGISPHCSYRSDFEEDAEMEDTEMDLDELEPDDFEPEGRNVIKRVWTPEEDANPHPNPHAHPHPHPHPHPHLYPDHKPDSKPEPNPNYTPTLTLALTRTPNPNQDAILLRLVNEHGPRSWSEIASGLPGRVGKQCRER
jgi:hypothetical protein